jgi:hypothetical protein
VTYSRCAYVYYTNSFSGELCLYNTHLRNLRPQWMAMTCSSARTWWVKYRITCFNSQIESHSCYTLGHWYLTELLMPALQRGKESSPDKHARVITTSSIASYLFQIHWNTLKEGPTRRKIWPILLYCQSKFVCIIRREKAIIYSCDHRVMFSLLERWLGGTATKESSRSLWIQVIFLNSFTSQSLISAQTSRKYQVRAL